MHLCGQSMLCTAPGYETACTVPSSKEFLEEIYHSKCNDAKPSRFHKARPDLCLLWASITSEVTSNFLIVTSSSSMMWAGYSSAQLPVWLG